MERGKGLRVIPVTSKVAEHGTRCTTNYFIKQPLLVNPGGQT